MKKLVVLAVASLVATSANAAEMKWSGSTGWRYSHTKNDDSRGSTDANGHDTSERKIKAHQLRANLGATGGWENIEWGVGVRTTGTANDDFVTVQNNTDRTLGIEHAWFRYVKDFGALDMSATVGRQDNVMAYDSVTENLFDNDVRWDGLGWKFKFGMFGFNAAQYVTGARSQGTTGASTQTTTASSEAVASTQSKFNYMFGFQPTMNWKFTDAIEAMFAVGFYKWSDESHSNTTNGGVADYNTGTTNPAVTTGSFAVHNPQQWQFYTSWTLPYSLSVTGEFVANKKNTYSSRSLGTSYIGNGAGALTGPEAKSTAWMASITYGALKKAHDFTVGYAYGNRGLASVINDFAGDSFAADNTGHVFNLGYAVANNFNVNWKYYALKEKSKLSPLTGAALTNNQQMKTNYWELAAGVMF